jgi:hypothetical protein
MRVSSYSKVDAVEKRYMVNSGVRGKKDWNPRTEVYWYSTLMRVLYCANYLTYHIQVPSTGKLQ